MDLPGPIHDILVVFLRSVLILGGLGVVLFTNLIYSTFSLGLVLVCISLLYILANFYFVAPYLCLGLITSRNMVRALMCLELILNLVNLKLVTFSDLFDNRQLKGDIFSLFVKAIAAAEAAIGLTIVSSIHRNRKSTRIN